MADEGRQPQAMVPKLKGNLFKKGRRLGMWHERQFVLFEDGQLMNYKVDDDKLDDIKVLPGHQRGNGHKFAERGKMKKMSTPKQSTNIKLTRASSNKAIPFKSVNLMNLHIDDHVTSDDHGMFSFALSDQNGESKKEKLVLSSPNKVSIERWHSTIRSEFDKSFFVLFKRPNTILCKPRKNIIASSVDKLCQGKMQL